MWKLLSIHAKNLCAFRELHYKLFQGVTTLIFGNNMDNDSQKSNGSGKSALVEAVALGITGAPLRRIKNEEIINDMADQCMVTLHLQNDTSNEELYIERHLSRKGPAVVECSLFRDGVSVNTGEAVHPTVDAYNKYILNKLGITKDELYNNFILSRHKYQDFLSSSDKDKKEIINRFSNAILVDKAIEKLIEDKLPVESKLREAELTLAGIDGRIGLLTEQIKKEESLLEEKQQTKAEHIRGIHDSINEKRTSIRQKREEIELVCQAVSLLEIADKQVQELENSELPMEECLMKLKSMLTPHIEQALTSWDEVILQKKNEIKVQEENLNKWNEAIEKTETEIMQRQAAYTKLQNEFKGFCEKYPEKVQQYDLQLKELNIRIEQLTENSELLKKERRTILTAIENIKAKLTGIITCPACQYEFLLSDDDYDIPTARKELEENEFHNKSIIRELDTYHQDIEDMERAEGNLKGEKRTLIGQHTQWNDQMTDLETLVNQATQKSENLHANRKRVSDAIAFIQEDIRTILRRVFDEAFERIDDSYHIKEKKKNNLEQDIVAANNAISLLEGMLSDMDKMSDSDVILSLKKSLKEYRKQSSETLNIKNGFEKRLQKFEEQSQLFLQFKSYLANTKIEALSKVTNEFLESIDSDIRIKFSGYTVLKSGKVREKISVSLLRNGIDCGSFDKFSEGEKARVNLANILAMNKLVNSSAEDGKGMDLLILDEILAAVDENGLACIFLALNRVAITSLVISHGNIAENYPHTLIINKHNGQSFIHEDN